MNDPENTTPEMLMEAAAIAQANGLRYVYAGNIPGRVGDLENTRCHHCRACWWSATDISSRPTV